MPYGPGPLPSATAVAQRHHHGGGPESYCRAGNQRPLLDFLPFQTAQLCGMRWLPFRAALFPQARGSRGAAPLRQDYRQLLCACVTTADPGPAGREPPSARSAGGTPMTHSQIRAQARPALTGIHHVKRSR